MKNHSNLSTTNHSLLLCTKTFGSGGRSPFAVAGLIGAAGAATDFCQETSQHALEGCQDNAERRFIDRARKCDNFSDPTVARTAATRQRPILPTRSRLAAMQFDARQTACQRLGLAPYDPVIDPTNFIDGVNNLISRCLQAGLLSRRADAGGFITVTSSSPTGQKSFLV